ncbi:translocator protein [Entomortierella parvispora]|uniref:Translocator protein n=1 Tax=Entomortierella parvispora TaxID=205924 RepID=A0A9P3M0F7_9FUNG|nr:translocator protein [Entomortierella parvispora]
MFGDNCQQVCQSFNTNLARYPIVAVGLPLIGGFLSAIPSHRVGQQFYEGLQKPDWAAPACAFAPAWTALYLSVGYASHLVALRTGPNTIPSIRNLARTGLGIYGLNLALNFAWSPLMFWKQKIGASLVTAGGLTASSAALAYYFFKVDKCAGYLTIPYVVWLGYNTALNYDIWIKNGKGAAADSARKLGKEVHDAAKHAKDEIEDAAKHLKDGAKDAARSANKAAKDAAHDVADKVDKELR